MIFVILGLALVLRIWNINQSLWLDEAAQAIESSQNPLTIISNMQADFHPPLFHLLMHFWLVLGRDEWIMRLLPISFGIGSILVTYFLTKKIWGDKVAYLASFLLAINPFHIYYSQEIRPYMAGLFFSVLHLYILWILLNSNKRYINILFTLVSAVLFYSSYFGFFLVFSEAVAIFLSGRYRVKLSEFLLALFFAFLIYLPWVPQIFAQIQVSQGIERDLPGWKDAVSSPVYKVLPLTLTKFVIGQISFAPKVLYGLIGIFCLSVWGFVIYKGVEFKDLAWRSLFTVLSLSLILPVLVSLFLQIASPKRLIFTLPIILILLSYGVIKLSKIEFKILLALILIINVYCLFLYESNSVFQREDWKSAVWKVDSLADQNTAVLFKFSAPFAPYLWYNSKDLTAVGLGRPLQVSLKSFRETEMSFADKSQIFLFQYLTDLSDPNKIADSSLHQLGFRKVDVLNFPGVGIVDYYKK